MALEQRNGRDYYYTSRRVGRTVLKLYRGSGALAGVMAKVDAIKRQKRKLRSMQRKDKATWRLLRMVKVRGWFTRINGVVAAAMTASGWHQHNRSEWRKKRGMTMTMVATTSQLRWHGPELKEMAGTLDPVTAEKAGKGDQSVLAAVDTFLDRPAAVALWGDMGRRVLLRWVRRYAGTCLTTERALLRHAADLRDRLTGRNPDALVQLVAERVVIAWVTLNYFENHYAAAIDKLLIPQQKFHTKRIELAHRNLLSACRTLAKVKRAKLPDVVALVNVVPTVG